MTKKILVPTILILLIGGIMAGYFLYQTLKRPPREAFDAIPANAVVVFESQDLIQLTKKIASTDYWSTLDSVVGMRPFTTPLSGLQSALSQSPQLKELLHGANGVLSLHLDSSGMVLPLYVINTQNRNTSLTNPLLQHHPNAIASLTDTDSVPGRLYFHHQKNIWMASPSATLLHAAANTLQSAQPAIPDSAYIRIRQTAGKKAEANIYIHYPALESLLSHFAPFGLSGHRLAHCTELDLKAKKQEILLNGYTIASDSTRFFLDLFRNQSPTHSELEKIIPANVIAFTNLRYNSFVEFQKALKTYTRLNPKYPEAQQLAQLKKTYQIDFSESVKKWAGCETALLHLPNHHQAPQQVALFFSHDPASMLTEWDRIYRKTKSKRAKNREVIKHRGFLIKEINAKQLLQPLFGPLYKNMDAKWYCIADHYLILAPSANAIKAVLNAWKSDKSIAQNKDYQHFSDNLSEKTNLFVYLNLRQWFAASKWYNPADQPHNRETSTHLLSRFQAIALQFSQRRDLYYTNIYAHYQPTVEKQHDWIWQTTLDSPISKGPFAVKNHRSGASNLLVTDVANNLYLIDDKGTIIWKNSLSGPLIGGVSSIDFYHNGKYQYLLNTTDHIYLFDLNGNSVESFPVKLAVPATNAVAAIDYNKHGNYRFFVAGNDNLIYNLNKKGQPTKGWRKPKVKSRVSTQIQRIVANNKDYIIAAQDNGQVLMTDRKGNSRIKIEKSFTNALNSSFYKNNTNSKGFLLTTDAKGDVVYIPSKGKIRRTHFGDFSHQHHFIYADYNGDNAEDFVFFDQKKLIVFDRFRKILLESDFASGQPGAPSFIDLPKRKPLIAIYLRQAEKIKLFTGKKALKLDDQIQCDGHFLVDDLSRDSQFELISAQGATLSAYPLQWP